MIYSSHRIIIVQNFSEFPFISSQDSNNAGDNVYTPPHKK